MKYTPASAGAKTITFTNSGILGNPSNFSFTSNTAAVPPMHNAIDISISRARLIPRNTDDVLGRIGFTPFKSNRRP